MRIDVRGAKKTKNLKQQDFFFWLNYSIFIKKLESIILFSADETKAKAFLSNIRKAF